MFTKKSTNIALIILTFLVMMALPCRADNLGYSKERPLIVGLDADFAPLEFVDEDGIPHGYDVDFTKLLMKRLRIPFTYAPNTWERIAGDVLHGRVDLGMMIYSDYRKDSTNYSRAVFRIYYQIVYRKVDDDKFDVRNLKGCKVAYMKSRPVGEMLLREGAERYSVANLQKAMYDLADGKYDALICFRYQARYYIVNQGLSELKAQDLSLQPREYCYVSHSKPLIAAINQELKQMEDEGIIDDVYGKDIKSEFGSIEIPDWVWYLLVGLFMAFLIIAGTIQYVARKRLNVEHQKLVKAYDLLAKQTDDLILAKDQAEESLRMKSNFIKQISHEIRTPLNAVSGFAQIMTSLGTELDAQTMNDATHQIVNNTERIIKLVDKMLELSEANSQTVIRRDSQVSAANVAQLSIDNSKMPSATHVTFAKEWDEATGETLLTTNHRMASRVLTILLDNAYKFTKAGSVKLVVKKDDQKVVFRVEDTGIGVPVEEAEHIFDEFVQLDEYYDGTGIGLTIARSIARRLGGDLVLDTKYKDGACFVFTLPLS